MTRRTSGAVTAVLTVAALSAAATPALAASGAHRGPSTTVDPYVIPAAEGVQVTSLLTVGDEPASNGYGIAGIPDGLGAYATGGGSFKLLMNHELRPNVGVTRRHGQAGAFVSEWRIDRRTLEVRSGRDLIDPGTEFWDYPSQTYRSGDASQGGANPRRPSDTFAEQVDAFARFCSSTLSEAGQFFNRRTRRGTEDRLYFANEENGNEGRLFGVTTDGTAKQLPRLGLFSWENTKPAFNRSNRTVVAGLEDTGPDPADAQDPWLGAGQLWIYTGVKRRRGDEFARAGLTNGVNHVIDVVEDRGVTTDDEFANRFGKGRGAGVDLKVVDWDQSGAAQNAEARQDGLSFNRIEDGAWDPQDRNVLYFVTTEGGKPDPERNGRVWKLEFEDIEDPELGAELTMVLDGSEGPGLVKPDNVDIDRQGNLLIQEDPGADPLAARIHAYNIRSGKLRTIAQFDPALFVPGADGKAKLTIDEESSGIIDATDVLGKGWYLLDAQVHAKHPDPALVEHGQLMAMKVNWNSVDR